jgi:hypothetical protein
VKSVPKELFFYQANLNMKDELNELNQIGIVDPINPNFKKAL